MKFPGGFNMQGMMKQAQQMQEKMQKEMEELRVFSTATRLCGSSTTQITE